MTAVDKALLAAERSSAAEAASILFKALGWAQGGLMMAALEIVAENERLKERVKELESRQCSCGRYLSLPLCDVCDNDE